MLRVSYQPSPSEVARFLIIDHSDADTEISASEKVKTKELKTLKKKEFDKETRRLKKYEAVITVM